MDFTIVGDIADVETIARGSGIREISRLRKFYGPATWRKRKGRATIHLTDGRIRRAEVHWYEASGVGKRELKIKRYLD